MFFDVNAWLGHFPFRSLRDNTASELLARMDREGIDFAAVASIDAMFHRNVQPANERLAQWVEPYRDRLFPMAVINPTYAGWERDLQQCHEELGMIGVRLAPMYHGYRVDGIEARRALGACRERGLPVSIPQRIEDSRQSHPIDPGIEIPIEPMAQLFAAEPQATLIVTNARGNLAGSSFVTRPDLKDAAWYFDLSLALGNFAGQTTSLYEKAGAGHMLFGTHLPFSYATPAMVKWHLLPASDEEKADIAYRNAARIFGLELGRKAVSRSATAG